MMEALPFLVTGAVFIGVVLALVWLAARVRRRGVGGEIMAIVDDVFRPTANRSHYEIRAQEQRRAPMSAPGGD